VKGNFHAPFLGELRLVTAAAYPAMSENMYDIVPQHLSDMVKTKLSEVQFPAVKPHIYREHVYNPVSLVAIEC